MVAINSNLVHKELIPLQNNWSSVPLNEIFDSSYRLDASYYGVKKRRIVEQLEALPFPLIKLKPHFVKEIYYGGRAKRIYVNKSKDSIGFLGSSEMLDVYPQPVKYLVNDSSSDSFRVYEGQILISRSGTIGNVTFVSKTLEKYLISEHAIRINANEYPGYVYTFLKSNIGHILVQSHNFGAVVSQIEPEHLENISVPNPPVIIKKKIHDLIEESFKLRDESNELISQSQLLLKEQLDLPEIQEFLSISRGLSKPTNSLNFSVSISDLQNRIDASFHNPVIDKIISQLKKHAKEIKLIKNTTISKDILLPGRFKRIYVDEGNGVVFFGGKQIYELDPVNKKYLSLKHHGDRIREQLTLKQNMILITCSGTIGKVAIVPRHWNGWTANQHIIRVIPANDEMAGYLYTWLSSEYCYPLITRFTYGAVVNEIDATHVANIVVPILKSKNAMKTINQNIMAANEKRTEAYNLEQAALKLLDELVIYAK